MNARLAATAAAKVKPALAVPAAPPAPAASAAEPSPFDSGFDFLQEETTEPSGMRSADHGSTTVLLQGDLDLEPSDAFGFEAPDDVHEELSVSADLTPALPPEPMPTVQRMDPRDAMAPGLAEDSLFDDDALHEAETMPPVGLDEPTPSGRGGRHDEDATRVVVAPAPTRAPAPVREDALTSVLPDDGAGDTVLDPSGARDYDVSSSDLGDLLATGPDGDLTPPTTSRGAREEMFGARDEAGLDEDAALGESFAAAELEPEALAPPQPPRPPTPAPPPAALRPPAPPASPAPGRTAAASRPAAPAPAADLSPAARQQLHDALEKVAWEAFGDVTERIVREALARIEEVAWEVIPQMAESLIREEIRKLKDEA